MVITCHLLKLPQRAGGLEEQDAEWVDLMEIYTGVFKKVTAGSVEDTNDDIPQDQINDISKAIMGQI